MHDTYDDVHKTRQLFFIVHAAVIPTSVFPAPQGNTIMPDLARLLHSISVLQHTIDSKSLTRYQTSLTNFFLDKVESQ